MKLYDWESTFDTQVKNPSVGCNLQACEEFETTILEEKPILHVLWDS